VVGAACENLSEDEFSGLLGVASQLPENASDVTSTISLCAWRRGFRIPLPDCSPIVWAAAMRRIASLTEYSTDVIRVIYADRSVDRFDVLFDRTSSSLENLIPFVISLLDPERELGLVCRCLRGTQSNDKFVSLINEFDTEVRKSLLSVPTADLAHIQVIMRAVLLDKDIVADYGKLVQGLLGLLELSVRFGVCQLMALLPEAVPSGKLVRSKTNVLTALRRRLDAPEPKQVVRKQIAIAITNWLNVSGV
jgi:hypothetical protein